MYKLDLTHINPNKDLGEVLMIDVTLIPEGVSPEQFFEYYKVISTLFTKELKKTIDKISYKEE